MLRGEPILHFRAASGDAAERRSVEDGFPVSVHWGWPVKAESGDRVLVDLTDFALRDAHGVVERLRRTEQGSWSLASSRSVLHLPGTKSFPRKTEIEAVLTTLEPGALALPAEELDEVLARVVESVFGASGPTRTRPRSGGSWSGPSSSG